MNFHVPEDVSISGLNFAPLQFQRETLIGGLSDLLVSAGWYLSRVAALECLLRLELQGLRSGLARLRIAT